MGPLQEALALPRFQSLRHREEMTKERFLKFRLRYRKPLNRLIDRRRKRCVADNGSPQFQRSIGELPSQFLTAGSKGGFRRMQGSILLRRNAQILMHPMMKAFFRGHEVASRRMLVMKMPAKHREGCEGSDGRRRKQPRDGQSGPLHEERRGGAGGSEKSGNPPAGGCGRSTPSAVTPAVARETASTHGHQRVSQRCHATASGFQPAAR